MIAVINYGMGNTRSVVNALIHIGCDAVLIDSPNDLCKADKIILPGVGAFGEGMQKLGITGFDKALREAVINRGVPFLGICLGMQLLADTGYENGKNKGLGWIAGTVERFNFSSPTLRIPHVGWNNLIIERPSTLFPSCESSPDMYFVHSYCFCPEQLDVVTSWCDYGGRFVASIQKHNIFGAQFHPEKSFQEGLGLLKRFVDLSETDFARHVGGKSAC